MDPTNTPLEVEFDGKPIKLIFDIDTQEAFEEATGKSYMNWAMGIFHGTQKAALAMQRDALKHLPESQDGASEEELAAIEDERRAILATRGVDAMRLASVMTMKDFRCILWAAYHEPGDRNRGPRWRMTIDQVRGKIDPGAYLRIAPQIVTAVVQNMSRSMGIKQPDEPPRPTNLSPIRKEPIGGSDSGPSADDVLASLETR